MNEDTTQPRMAQSWKEKLQYWATIGGVVFALFFLFVMLFYGTVFTTECDFVRFITFQC